MLINDVATLESKLTIEAPYTNYIVKAGIVDNIFNVLNTYANINAKSIEFTGKIGQSVTLYPITKKLEAVDRAYGIEQASFSVYPDNYKQYKIVVRKVTAAEVKIIAKWTKNNNKPTIFLTSRENVDPAIITRLYELNAELYFTQGF